MIDALNTLYREYSTRPGPSPGQSHALADAAFVLGSTGIPSSMIREAMTQLRGGLRKIPKAVLEIRGGDFFEN
jgi:hypothetical protein